jgi:AraC-like DNA-binding protein
MRDRKYHTPGRSRAALQSARGTISIAFVRAVVDAVRAQGADPDALLRRADIRPSLLAIDASRVSARQYAQLWRCFIADFADEFFAQDGRRMKPGSFALLCRSVVHCTNLGDALERASRFIDVLLDDLALEITTAGNRARITLGVPRGAPVRVFAHETLLVMVHGLACWLVGRRIPLLHAAFAYPAPPRAAEYRDMFCASLTFAARQTSIEFAAALLELPVVQSERTAKEFLRIAPENILLKYKSAHSLAARIRRRLRQVLPDDLPDLEAIARELAIAPATLRRKLKAEGQSYQAIKDDLRRDLAITYLSATDLSIRDIALALGFLEPSAFHRAFRKWAHTSPGAYRRAEHDRVPPKTGGADARLREAGRPTLA